MGLEGIEEYRAPGMSSGLLFVLEAGDYVEKTVDKAAEAAKILFLLVDVARKNFLQTSQQRSAVTMAYCSLEGKIRANADDLKLIERELAK